MSAERRLGIAGIDDAVGKFTEYLRANGIEKLVVFVAADMGESTAHFVRKCEFKSNEVLGIFSVQCAAQANAMMESACVGAGSK